MDPNPTPPPANPATATAPQPSAVAGEARGPGERPEAPISGAPTGGSLMGPPPSVMPSGASSRALGVRLLAPLGTLAGVAAAFAYVGAVDPNEPGHYPVCPLLRFTGLYCPGCGGLRSAHAFVHGDFGAALSANALAVVGYGLFAVVMAVWLIRAVRAVPMRIAITPAWGWGMGALLALFTLVRNLPFGSALAP